MNTARCSDNDLRPILKGLHVITHAGTTDAGVALNVHEITNGDDDFLNLLGQFTGRCQNQSLALLDRRVNLLKNGNRESSRLSSTGLGLGNHIMALDDGHDSTLLDSRRALKTIGIDYSTIRDLIYYIFFGKKGTHHLGATQT